MAASGSKVEYLPGLQHQGPLPFELITGYIGVGEGDEVQVFYYFIKSERDPTSDPILMWISGGPGCSSLFAFVHEFGPAKLDIVAYNGSLPTLSLNPHSWSKVSNLLLVDLPVRSGFSYSTTERCNTSDTFQQCDHAEQFMRKWLVDYPEYLTNPLYVGGDSYSGLVVPIIAHKISDGNEARTKPWINLKGYILGNPMTKVAEDAAYVIPFISRMGFIPEDLFEKSKKHCYEAEDVYNVPCMWDSLKITELIQYIYPAHILEPPCSRAPEPYDESNGERRLLTERPTLPSSILCWDDWYKTSEYWANDDSVREALHVRKGSVGQWKSCNPDLGYTASIGDVFSYHVNLSAKGYRSLVYSGDHDAEVPYLATKAWIESLNYSTVEYWRPWIVDGGVGGYTTSYSNNMTFATVKGSGHIVPFFTPSESSAMFKRWISGEKL
ncbi:PREDICTED: serine carboxypeptidase-like 7 isoform X2 [Ipomoea nil]|uniref:serine carboxypeptidase-like 7 isoform X2 n=1 Tax=Ipomoea nil TaxID=35883 RepID=UPI000901431B|nr:PREDICTED: serine carboxypeptidase-like 7 isoform X2 [Ipomoea nil]